MTTNTMLCKSFASPRQTQLTSILSFEKLKNEGVNDYQSRRILEVLKGCGNLNNNEIATITHLKISSVTARVHELRMAGKVFFVGHKKDRVTNRKTMVWGVPENE